MYVKIIIGMQNQCSLIRVCIKLPGLEMKERIWLKEQQAAEEFLCLGSEDVLDCMFGWFGSSLEDEYSPELD